MWTTIVQIGKNIMGYVIGSPTILLGCALGLSLMVTLSYRSSLKDLEKQMIIQNAAYTGVVAEIREGNTRTANIAVILDEIQRKNAENIESFISLGAKIDQLPKTLVCTESAPIDAVREWLRNQDSRSTPSRKD